MLALIPLLLACLAGVGLHEAAQAGDVEGIRAALRSGAAIDATRSEGWSLQSTAVTALFVAAREGHTDVVRVLLEAGADPNVRCVEGGTALTIAAARYDRSAILKLLLEAGADVVGPRPKKRPALGWSAMNGDFASFVLLLRASREAGLSPADERVMRDNLQHRNDDLRHVFDAVLAWNDSALPLAFAARLGSADDLERSLAAGADHSEKDSTGWSALHWAAGYEGSVAKVRTLLGAGANPNAATAGGFTPLMAGVQSCDAERVGLLLAAGADPNAVDVDRRTALHIAAWRSPAEIVRVLLLHGADPTIRDRSTQTAQDLALRRKDKGYGDVSSVFDGLVEHWSPTTPDQLRLTTVLPPDALPPNVRITKTEFTTSAGVTRMRATVWLYQTSIDLAFDATWRAPGFSVPAGTLVAREGAVRAFQLDGSTNHPLPDVLELVLSPNRSLAFDQLKHSRAIWGNEIVLRCPSQDR